MPTLAALEAHAEKLEATAARERGAPSCGKRLGQRLRKLTSATAEKIWVLRPDRDEKGNIVGHHREYATVTRTHLAGWYTERAIQARRIVEAVRAGQDSTAFGLV